MSREREAGVGRPALRRGEARVSRPAGAAREGRRAEASRDGAETRVVRAAGPIYHGIFHTRVFCKLVFVKNLPDCVI